MLILTDKFYYVIKVIKVIKGVKKKQGEKIKVARKEGYGKEVTSTWEFYPEGRKQ